MIDTPGQPPIPEEKQSPWPDPDRIVIDGRVEKIVERFPIYHPNEKGQAVQIATGVRAVVSRGTTEEA